MLVDADARHIPLADESVQCCVTSPPYWGLREYAGLQDQVWKDGWCGQLGLEPTPQMYVDHLVQIFREVRRVLRQDGTCWIVLGDSYAATTKGSGGYNPKQDRNRGSWHNERSWQIPNGLKPKDLCGIPWRVAFALQADGWWLRSDCIWSKPNPMPESVTDRPTKAHEYVFLLAKSERYFYDVMAIAEPAVHAGEVRITSPSGFARQAVGLGIKPTGNAVVGSRVHIGSTRNCRSVWEIATQAYGGTHFATYPEELPRRCIKAGTSECGGCRFCGAPWERITHSSVRFESGSGRSGNPPAGKWLGSGQDTSGSYDIRMGPVVESPTIGWSPTCRCRNQHGRTVPQLVLDPFGGSGTTARVAIQLGRKAMSLDLSYHNLAKKRTSSVQRELLMPYALREVAV